MLRLRLIELGTVTLSLSVAVTLACGSSSENTEHRGAGAGGAAAGTAASSGSSGISGANGGNFAAGTAGNTAGSATGAASSFGGAAGQSPAAGTSGTPGGSGQAGGGAGTDASGQAGAAGAATMSEGGAAGATGEAGATGDAGEAGAASSVDVYECSLGGFTVYQRNATVRQSTRGTNGTFTDRCEDSNLVEYLCESELVSGVGYIDTGEVASMPSDCGGRCVDGACPNICPTSHTPMLFVSVDSSGRTTLEDTVTGFTYDCNLTAQAEPGACTSFEVGDVVENYYSTDCIGQSVTMTLGWDGLEMCAYTSCATTI